MGQNPLFRSRLSILEQPPRVRLFCYGNPVVWGFRTNARSSFHLNCDPGRVTRCVVGLYSNHQSETSNELLLMSDNFSHPSTIDKLQSQLIRDAKDFCLIIDNIQYYQNQEWLSEMSRILSRIQMAMTHMDSPKQKMDYTALNQMDDRFELYCKLKEMIGDMDGYWMDYDQKTELDDQSGSLAGDFSDLYFEFKRGLELSGDQIETNHQAILLWKTGYFLNWGQHLLDAQKHLYMLKASDRY